MKGKNLVIGSIVATTLLTTSMTTSIFAQSIENDIYLEQTQVIESQVNENSRGVGGAIAGGIIGAASGTLTGVIGDIVSGDDVTLGSVVVDFVGGAVSSATQGSKLPF